MHVPGGMGTTLMKAETGSKVAVIGGGPAGSLFALHLLRYAREAGIDLEVTIYEARDFGEPGPKGCKGCAGILSPSLLRNLGELGLSIPDEIVASKIAHYTVHGPNTSVSIPNPDRGIQIASIYRGAGPRTPDNRTAGSFDGWLIKQALSSGAKVEREKVSRVVLGERAHLEVAGGELDCDLVVLASGVNAARIPILGLAYFPPKTRVMAQAELYVGAAQVQSLLGDSAHAFLLPRSGLVFGTLVPKGPFINVSVLSSGKHTVSVSEFLSHETVRSVLPERYERVCSCAPRAAIGPAHNYCAARFVAVGDAAVSRLYKDGIGSALLTGREAARTAVRHGFSRQDFERHYTPFCNAINSDNRWGRLLFSINNRAKDSRVFLLAQQRRIAAEQEGAADAQPFTKAAWGMFTGSYSYGTVARLVFSPVPLARLLGALFLESPRALLPREAAYRRKLHVGARKVLLLGSGFGSTYVLRNVVPALNRNEKVETTMLSDENFFLFSPLLHEVAMGSIETRHIAYPIRRLHWRDRFNFVQATVEKIDLGGRKVLTSTGALGFDYLVLGLGAVTDTTALDPVPPNVFTLKTLRDSMLIRNHIIDVFERASAETDPLRQRQLLTFVVAGTGYIPVQLATGLRDFVHRDLTRYYKTVDPDTIRVILVEAQPKVVPELDPKVGAYVSKHLRQKGIEVRLNSRVTRAWEVGVELNATESIPTETVIWAPGVRANPRIAELDVATDNMGRVVVNDYMEVPGAPGVFAVGDCAHFESQRTGQPIPPRAHTTVRQARVVAHNILAEIRGKDKKRYRYSSAVEMISLGSSKAVFSLGRLKLYGFPARLVWLVAYSGLVTGSYNRVRIVMDWLLSLVFGRDTTYLKPMR